MHSLDLGHYSRFAMEIEGYKSQVSSYYLSPAISPCPSDEVYSVVFAVSTGAPVERLRGAVALMNPIFGCTLRFCQFRLPVEGERAGGSRLGVVMVE